MLLLTLSLLLAAPPATAGNDAAPAPTAAPAAPTADVASAKAPSGLTVSADVRDAYVAGFPLLVTVTVSNPGTTPLSFPNLSVRPHLVHFAVAGPKGKTVRHTTPPEVEPTSTWTLPAGSSQRVVLEVPSSGAFAPGNYTIGVSVVDPAGTVTLPERTAILSAAKPVGGAPVWEPTIATNLGAMFPWLNETPAGFDLYLMAFDAKAPTRPVAQYPLAHLKGRVDPVLARSRPGDAQSRHVYWLDGNSLHVGRLAVTRFDGPVRTYTLPYPKVELLDRGVTDADGGLVVPVWIPNPTGAGGTVRAWCINERGQQLAREVATYTRKPTLAATAVDAGSNLVLALAHADGVDVYRVDPGAHPDLPPTGKRAWKPEGGWTPRRLAFDVLPDAGDKPGGLSLLTVLTRVSNGAATHRALLHNLGGEPLNDTGERPWPFTGDIVDLLPAGYGPFYVLSRDGAGWTYGAQGGTAGPVKTGDGVLWSSGDKVYVRSWGGATVVKDTVVGPRQQ